MATERTAAPLSGFFKFNKVGQSVVGHVNRFITANTTNGPSTFMILRPVLIHDGNKTPGTPLYERWESCAIGLSADLRGKLSQRDEGLFVRITYDSQEPTKKGNPKRVFKVEILEPSEIRALNDAAGKDHQAEPYFADKVHGDSETSEEGDDLPF